MDLPYKHIVVEGVIGAGKTSLAKKLSEDLNARLILEEFSTNTFLEKFYQNPERYAFPVEIGFLVERFQQLESEYASDLFQPTLVADYLFEKSNIFAKMNLGNDHYQIFKKLFDIFVGRISKPDLIIYLYNTPDGLLRNIQKRARSMEDQINRGYLIKLQNLYLTYFKQAAPCPVLLLDLTAADFVEFDAHYQRILELLQQPIAEHSIERVSIY